MATSMKFGVQRCLSYCQLSVSLKNGLVMPRSFATLKKSQQSKEKDIEGSSSNSITPLVGMSEDGQTVVCWHPEPEHPYEHTQPMDYNKEELSQGTSVLKDQVLRNYDSRVRPTGPNTQELSHITFTTKHRWFPKPGKKFAKRDPPKDRDAI